MALHWELRYIPKESRSESLESEVQSAILRRYFKFLCERCQNAVPVVGQSRKRTETERERHIIDALFGHAGVFQISAYCNLLPTFSFAYNCSMQSDSKDPRLFTKSRPSTDRVHALAHLRGLLVAFDEIARRYRCIRPWYRTFLRVFCLSPVINNPRAIKPLSRTISTRLYSKPHHALPFKIFIKVSV